MKKILRLVIVDSIYCDYLRQFDYKVPFNYGKKESRPFVGVLFEVGDYKYFAPLSSPKPKHLKMKKAIDFMKIDGGKLGIVNFNNMIPVMDNNIKEIELKNGVVDKYTYLLKLQLYALNRSYDKLSRSSKSLYDK